MTILQDLTSQTETLQQTIARLQAENAALRAARSGKLHLKVSKAGAISVYGMGRFPVTLYRGQMERLLAAKEDILTFVKANADQLAVRGE